MKMGRFTQFIGRIVCDINHSINATNDIYISDYDNCIHKYYSPILSSNNYEDVSFGSEYDSAKRRVRRN